jgi:PAS domain S-box-containing protein
VNLLDKNFQFTVSKVGDWEGLTIPKEESVCQFTVNEEELLVINDTHRDERTKTIREITENPDIRFYAGVPIKSPNGSRIGAFCVIDETPKELSGRQKQALIDLGKEVELRIKLLEQKAAVDQKNKTLEEAAAFLDNSADILWVIDPLTFKIRKSNGAESILGRSDSEVIGNTLPNLVQEINFEHHIKQWVNNQDGHPKLGIPIKVSADNNEEIWLSLTFTKYNESLLVTGRDITKQQRAEQKLKHSLEEKEVLLSEVHHRVKNNLAVVQGLLQLERFKSEDDNIHSILLNSESRILSISKIHEILYQTNDFANVQLEAYLEELISHLRDSFIANSDAITIDLKVADLSINVNQALPVGLILNELIANAIKHAFLETEAGTITVFILEKAHDIIQVEVSDNGKGLDVSASELQEKGNLGFNLISTLIEQIDANLEITSDNGTTFQFTFSKEDNKGAVSAL